LTFPVIVFYSFVLRFKKGKGTGGGAGKGTGAAAVDGFITRPFRSR